MNEIMTEIKITKVKESRVNQVDLKCNNGNFLPITCLFAITTMANGTILELNL
jgi:hypothetical protein